MLLPSVLPLAFQPGAALSAPLPRQVCVQAVMKSSLSELFGSCEQPGKPRPAEKRRG